MISKIYRAFLWLAGFIPGETITAMLRRQKARLGAWWWVGLAGIISGLTWLILHILGVC